MTFTKVGRLKWAIVPLLVGLICLVDKIDCKNELNDAPDDKDEFDNGPMDSDEEYMLDLAERTSEANRQGKTLQEMERPPARARVLGVEGVNYEMNGTVPYLTCQYLNRTACDPDLRSDCPKTEYCYLEGMQRQIACLGVFFYQHGVNTDTTNKYLNVSKKDTAILGCFAFNGDVKEEFCYEEACRAKEPRIIQGEPDPDMKRKKRGYSAPYDGYGFCCCLTKNCNKLGTLEMLNPNYVDVNEQMLIDAANNTNITSSHEYDPSLITTKTLLSLIILLLSIVFLSSIVVAGLAVRRRYLRVKARNEAACAGGEETGSSSLLMDDLSRNPLLSATSRFSASEVDELRLLARGRFGDVYRGVQRADDGYERLVAVKKHTLAEERSFIAEKEIFESFLKLGKWYPSIVRYIGSERVNNELWIVTEFHERLSLFELLKEHTISISTATRLILSMADGLQFLHDNIPFYFALPKPSVIHRDLKSKNILIKNDLTACIADFGLARKFEDNTQKKNDLLGQVGTRRYMSPEVLEGATEFTPAAFKQMDVYAMALVFWEVMSRIQFDETDVVPPYELPYEDKVGMNPQIGVMRNAVVMKRVRPTFRERIMESEITQSFESIIKEMWDAEACGRITAGCAFEKIWRTIFELQAEFKDYAVDENAMTLYHNSNGVLPYPSPDPHNDFPPVPIIPMFYELEDGGMGGVQTSRDIQNGSDGQDSKIYDMDLKRFITFDEARTIDCRNGEKRSESTATPEWSTD